ncbi:DUF2330 domain-containing protein [Polyangium aurulentum]|uniref:DUF2330 domain-containing protein n=1 Tax=Polyangium aurulentum TaxID=2567896 RepID=UPI0010AE4477|nr:DUF2330 domain-containing protein [Polyangium aurulentum]UQA54772.1 DUF2330 domain-containing protein [Polyangium aurulentum]
MRLGFLASVLASALLASLTLAGDAEACGACLVPASDNTVVTGHRMALSISTKQTVLWDQIQYDGAPENFAWVLPVKPGAVIEVSSDAWFETLDAATTAQVFAPPINCGSGGVSSPGCGAQFDAAGEFGGTGGLGPQVQVVHRGTVGPYETVTLSTETPGVLNDWLDKAGYEIDPASQPVVDAYVKEGFDFIALKLQPNKDVSEMKPVRVVQPGASPALPLRMVAIGTGANVAITLFVIGEGRWEAKNFTNAVTPIDLLAWDFKDQSSNYGTLRQKALEQNGGATWLTAFAQPGALLSPLQAPFTGGTRNYSASGNFGDFVDTIAAAYVQRGVANDEETITECTAVFPQIAQSSQAVVDPCPPGKPSDDPSCGAVGASEIDARSLACGLLDDVGVALTGMHPKDVWVTRLEANLPRAALATDLVVQAAASQETVDNLMQARSGKNTEELCGSQAAVLPEGDSRRGGRGPLAVGLGLAAAGLAAAVRRLRLRASARA